VAHRVVFAPEARDDLLQLYGYIAERSGAERALAFTDRIVAHCEGLATFPERGTKRDDLRPGLRVTGLARRVTIAFHVTGGTVTIDRILYAGRDLGVELGGDS
jgi:toxin ParE1/3/4